MRVLIGCEFSGVVRSAFRARGHDAWSCDLLPAEDGSEFHIQGDVLGILDQCWDLGVFHPPCTYLANSGVKHLYSVPSKSGKLPKVHGENRRKAMKEAAEFFNRLKNSKIPRKVIENPIPHYHATALIGDYSQLIQPWMFGHGETKATCLWLIGLPFLQPTHWDDDLFCKEAPKERKARIHLMPPGPNRSKERSRTYDGIARAMAEQWG